MPTYRYDASFNPSAPVLPIEIAAPLSPSAHRVRALVDSGADISVVPRQLAERLQLRRVDVVPTQGFGGAIVECSVFSVSLALEMGQPRIIRAILWEEDYALLGRDILNHWKVTLDGPRSSLDFG